MSWSQMILGWWCYQGYFVPNSDLTQNRRVRVFDANLWCRLKGKLMRFDELLVYNK